MSSILIQGGRVIDPARGFDRTADVHIVEGRVESIETSCGRTTPADDATVIDAEGCLVCPGLIDLHVHLREPDAKHRETIATGAAAAVAGGFSTVCCMPNTNPPLDDPDLVRFVQRRAASAHQARVFAVACGTAGRKGLAPAAIESLAAAGAVAFSDDGDVIADAGVMQQVLRLARAAGRSFMQHCQEPTLTRGASMNAGPLARRLGLVGWPREAEEVIIDRDARLNREIGCRYHVQHLSSGGSVEIVRRARRDGQPVTAEASPHHLLLTEDACAGYDTNGKMNPPLRTTRDVEQIKAAIAEGTITILATDHAPHPPERKRTDFASAAFGIVGLECALPLYARALVEDGVIDWPRLVAMMTIEPARLVGLHEHGLGTLAAGGPADVTVIDPDLEWTIDASIFHSTGRNCPFDGWSVRGRAVATLVSGRVRHVSVPGRLSPRDAAHPRG
ncbi:MAG: dihydroorotase [Planctomycetota bacterium]|jgi:dihydroorotase